MYFNIDTLVSIERTASYLLIWRRRGRKFRFDQTVVPMYLHYNL